MNEMNYYKLLDLPDFADIESIKLRYKQLVKIHHPDKGGKRKDFESIKQAYETLKDPFSKIEIDRKMKCIILSK